MGCLLRLRASLVGKLTIFLLSAGGVCGCETCPCGDPPPAPEAACPAGPCYPAVERPVAEGLAAALTALGQAPPACPRPLQVLSLSGGVAGVPFSAGLLVGWSQSGTRPTFDAVSGISSGSLLGVYAFLGSDYDAQMQHLILSLSASDFMKFRPLRCMLQYGAFGSAKPAERLIRRAFDDHVLADLRRAYAEGRRYFVGTMNLQTKRLAVWDITAIASSGRPDADTLVRKVLLAAVSWPGAAPPVDFDVEVNGHCYREQHCDAGPAAMAFVRFGPLPGWPGQCAPAHPGWLAGSDLYVLASRKLYADPAPVSRCALPRLTLPVTAIFEALTRSDIARLYSVCAVTGMRFHLLSVPQDFHGEPPSFSNLYPKEARRLFETGYRMGVGGPCWRLTPPGAEPGEEAVPRDGADIQLCR